MIPRVPAPLALLILRQSGYDLSPSTLRSWVRRKHITRTAQGYCLQEIEKYLKARDEEHSVSA